MRDNRIKVSLASYRFADRFVLTSGRQLVTNAHERGFRFLQLAFRSFEQQVSIHAVRAADRRYPIVARASFHSSDPLLDAIFPACARTLSTCATDTFIDCPWRELAFLVNDLAVENVIFLQAFGDPRLNARCLRLALSQRRGDGLIAGVCPAENKDRYVLGKLGKEAFGGVGSLCHGFATTPISFLQSTILGIAPLDPGFARFAFRPEPCDLRYAPGSVPTPRGNIEAAWKRVEEGLKVELRVPPSTSAQLPDGRVMEPGLDQFTLPIGQRWPRPAFFTRDLGYRDRTNCHARYSVVCLAVGQYEVAHFIRRFLRRPQFATKAQRLGCVLRPPRAFSNLGD